jgi:hypothetical protein
VIASAERGETAITSTLCVGHRSRPLRTYVEMEAPIPGASSGGLLGIRLGRTLGEQERYRPLVVPASRHLCRRVTQSMGQGS